MAQGSITKVVSERTGKITWRARYSFETDLGRRHRSKTFATRRDAQAWLTKQQHELRSGEYFAPTPMTFAAFAERWFTQRLTIVRSSTWHVQRGIYTNRVEPVMGELQMHRVTAIDIQLLVDNMMARDHKVHAVRATFSLVNLIFKAAVADGLLRTNPAAGRRLPKPTGQQRTVWTVEQVDMFLAQTKAHRYGTLWRLLLTTGLRIGEAIALRWDDVAIDKRTLRVTKTLRRSRGRGYEIGAGAKTKSSNRVVRMPASTTMALVQHRVSVVQRWGQVTPATLVFPNTKNGDICSYSAVYHAFVTAVEAIGLPRLRLHDLRHIAGSLLLEHGVPMKAVQERLGHASITMTMDTYAHLSERSHDAAASVYDEILASQEVTVEVSEPFFKSARVRIASESNTSVQKLP